MIADVDGGTVRFDLVFGRGGTEKEAHAPTYDPVKPRFVQIRLISFPETVFTIILYNPIRFKRKFLFSRKKTAIPGPP